MSVMAPDGKKATLNKKRPKWSKRYFKKPGSLQRDSFRNSGNDDVDNVNREQRTELRCAQ